MHYALIAHQGSSYVVIHQKLLFFMDILNQIFAFRNSYFNCCIPSICLLTVITHQLYSNPQPVPLTTPLYITCFITDTIDRSKC